jgi:hypothetical protein
MMLPSVRDVSAFYASALAALRYLEHQRPTARRFGADADARWASFRGDLTTADRIDLLVRDANAHWPRAFGARMVFGRRAVDEDEAFGGDWEPLDPVDAEQLWRAVMRRDPPATLEALVRSVTEAWGFDLAEPEPITVAPNDKLILAGPSAIVVALNAFASSKDVDWVAQVTTIATPPAHRQLAGLAGAVLGITKPSTILDAHAPASQIAGARPVVSVDADDTDAARAQELASR